MLRLVQCISTVNEGQASGGPRHLHLAHGLGGWNPRLAEVALLSPSVRDLGTGGGSPGDSGS